MNPVFVLFLLVSIPALAEIAAFVAVGSRIGIAPTLLCVLATALAGALLLRAQGFAAWKRIRNRLGEGEFPESELGNAAMILAAGLLLLIPGFLTDALGLLLFVPAIRRAIWRRIEARGKIRARIVDLDPDEFREGGE